MAREIVALEGELDFGTAFDVEMRLEQAIERADEVVIDLSRLTFIDSTGLRALLEATQAARRDSKPIEIVPGPPPVQRAFEVAGLLDELPFAA